jgi:hypothetical protein
MAQHFVQFVGVRFGLLNSLLSFPQFGGGHHLHRLGNTASGLDGTNALLYFT